MTDLIKRQLTVTLLDPHGVVASARDFEVNIPAGGSKDEDTDDDAAGAKIGEFVAGYASSMGGGGLAFSITAEFTDGPKG